MRYKPFVAVLLSTAFIALACSGGGSSAPVLPDQPGLTSGQAQTAVGTSKALWGVWQVNIDTQTWEATVIPLRGAQYTVDVVTFLQKPVGNPANLSLTITDFTQWFTDGLISVDVGLRHPFPGLDEYTGFDVYGVFVAPGTLIGQYDGNVAYTNGFDEPILLNADGYTRWMNPVEFPANGTIFRFVPGKLGIPDIGLFTSTINGYKYFADGLDKTQDIADYFADPARAANRGMFRPGSFNERAYDLKFPMVDGAPNLVFQYAVIASWQEPDKTLSGDPDTLDVPGDFPLNSNANEAIYLKAANNESTIFYKDGDGGGDIKLALEVFDWGALLPGQTVPDEVNQIIVEGNSAIIPGGYVTFDQATLAATASPGTTGISSVFQVEIKSCTPSSIEPVQLFITVENKSPDVFDPGTGVPGNDDSLAGYFFTSVPVAGEIPPTLTMLSPNGGETLWMALYHNITWYPGYGDIANVKLEWSTDDFVSDIRTIVANTPNDGSFVWKPIPNIATTTAKIRVTDVLGTASDTSDADFSIAVPVWLDFKPEVEVNNTNVTFNYVSYEQSWDEFSPCLAQNAQGQAHVVWHSLIYAQARETPIRSSDGDTWSGEGGCFFTSGGDTGIRDDKMKLASTPTTIYALIWHWNIYFSVDVDHYIHGHGEYNYPNNMLNDGVHCYANGEIMADDTYLYEVGDGGSYTVGNGPGLYEIRVTDPHWAWPMYEPLQTLTSYGEASHVRSWCRYNGTLALSYFTLGNQIRLLKQTDKAANTWDDTEVIFDGASKGYLNSRNPSICADGDGRLFAIWVAQQASTNEWHLLASMKESPTSAWTEPLIAATSTTEINDAHVSVSAEKVTLPTGDHEYVLLVGYEKDGVTISDISPMDLWAFLPAVQVSADGDITRDPDTLCTAPPYKYDAMFTWAFEVTPGALGVGNYDIKFRNANFKTP